MSGNKIRRVGKIGHADLIDVVEARGEGDPKLGLIAELLGFGVDPLATKAASEGESHGRGTSYELHQASDHAIAQSERRASSESKRVVGDTKAVDSEAAQLIEELKPELEPAVHFWRPVVAETNDDDDEPKAGENAASELLDPDDLGRPPGAKPREASELVPWSHLRRGMEEIARALRPGRAVDARILVDRLARHQTISRLPRVPRRGPLRKLVVIVDRSTPLIPVWPDQKRVFLQMRREFGDLVRCVWWNSGLPTWCSDLEARELVSRDLRADDGVLVLGDLGLHVQPHALYPGRASLEHRRWLELGRALRHGGVQTTALVPCPAERWPRGVAESWTLIDWGAPAGAGARLVSSHDELLQRRDLLISLLSWLVLIEPGLLREARRLIDADVGTEMDVWNHPDALRHVEGWTPGAELRGQAQARLLRLVNGKHDCGDIRTRLCEVVELVRDWRRAQPREIWMEEVGNLKLLGLDELLEPRESACAEAFADKVRDSIRAGWDPSADGSFDLCDWFIRSARSRDASAWARGWESTPLGRSLLATYEAIARRRGHVELPAGMSPDMFSGNAEHEWTIRQIGGHLVFGAQVGRGSPVVSLRGRSEWVVVGATMIHVQPGTTELEYPTHDDRLEIQAKGQRIVLAREARPSWASATGRDEFGLWASFSVSEVEQRMRWIPPGRFLMGSPDNEVGRNLDEGTRHEVTLTQGFWMADTPCTQELWQVVMDTNPSEFKGAQRPVDNVSWDDVQQFARQLERLTEQGFGLPTEAQWEYACRAGTTKARYGELSGIAWYAKNANVKTHDVGLKRANLWGLYDMLGNVWEWCADWHDSYPRKSLVDPTGPASGRARVARGGSCLRSADMLRAASRFMYEPSKRYVGVGFRLVLCRSPAAERSILVTETNKRENAGSRGRS